jgi:integrase
MGTPAKVVQEQLGHASIGATMNTYSFVVLAMMQAAADAMDRELAPPR